MFGGGMGTLSVRRQRHDLLKLFMIPLGQGLRDPARKCLCVGSGMAMIGLHLPEVVRQATRPHDQNAIARERPQHLTQGKSPSVSWLVFIDWSA